MTIDTNIESNTMSASVLVTIVARQRKHKPKSKKAVALWNFPKSAKIENSMTVLSYKIFINSEILSDGATLGVKICSCLHNCKWKTDKRFQEYGYTIFIFDQLFVLETSLKKFP